MPGIALRNERVMDAIRAAIAAGQREDFRVTHFNILGNHIHLLTEAENEVRLGRGMQGLMVRLARAPQTTPRRSTSLGTTHLAARRGLAQARPARVRRGAGGYLTVFASHVTSGAIFVACSTSHGARPGSWSSPRGISGKPPVRPFILRSSPRGWSAA